MSEYQVPSVDDGNGVRQADIDIAVQINALRSAVHLLLSRSFAAYDANAVDEGIKAAVRVSRRAQTSQAVDPDIAMTIAARSTDLFEKILRTAEKDAASIRSRME